MTNEERQAALAELSEGFMKPFVSQETYVQVETTAGTEIVMVTSVPEGVSLLYAGDFQDYCEGKILDPTAQLEIESGWLARLSAPGYTDCTGWTAHASREAAEEELIHQYGDAS